MARARERVGTTAASDNSARGVDAPALSAVGVPADAGDLGAGAGQSDASQGPGEQGPEAPAVRRFDEGLAAAEEKVTAPVRRPRKPRGSYKKAEKTSAPVISDYGPLLRPIFQLVSTVLESRGVQPLSEGEIEQGVGAFTPIAATYLPMLEGKAIWIAPVLWTGGVVFTRLKKKEK